MLKGKEYQTLLKNEPRGCYQFDLIDHMETSPAPVTLETLLELIK